MSRNHSRVAKFLVLLLVMTALPLLAKGQSFINKVGQRSSETLALIEKAEQNQYNVKWVEFCCELGINGRILFRKIGKFINEGDMFKRRNLYKSLQALSRSKAIDEVRLEDIRVNLDEERGIINIVYNIRERPNLK